MRVFIALTPYHLLLSCALAMTLRRHVDGSFGLVVIADFADAAALTEWVGASGAFEVVQCYPGAYGIGSRYLRQMRYRRTRSLVERFLKNVALDGVYVGNDARPEVQSALCLAKRRSPSTLTAYIEDGLNAYCAILAQPRFGPVTWLGMKLLFGTQSENVPVLGTSRWIDRVYALYPELLRPELSGLEVHAVPRGPFEDGRLARGAADYLRAAGIEAIPGSAGCAVVVISHSSRVPDGAAYRDAVLGLLHDVRGEGVTVFLKYHPREPRSDFLRLTGALRVLEIPKGIPIELLYLVRGEDIRLVVGDASTAMVTAKWLCSEARVVSLVDVLGQDPASGISAFFRRIGIHTPSATKLRGAGAHTRDWYSSP